MNIIKQLENGFSVVALSWGESSPLENHGAFKIGADHESRIFYVSEGLLRVYGTESVFSACERYPIKKA